jgi:hypothetical protein
VVRQQLPRLLRGFDPETVRQRLTAITGPLAAGAVAWSTTETHVAQMGLRNRIELLTGLLAENQTGLLITLDEIHHNQIGELRELATTVQHAFREERQLAFVGAGLASAVSDVVNDDVLTFLRRAEGHALGSVGPDDVRRALSEPVEAAGRTIADNALAAMVDGTRGYPFLIQLVGAQTWRLHPTRAEIAIEDARQGVANALRRLGSLIYEPALADASAIDKFFLLAMAKDNGPSKMAVIQGRLNVDVNYASQYRRRPDRRRTHRGLPPRLRRLRAPVPSRIPAGARRLQHLVTQSSREKSESLMSLGTPPVKRAAPA